MSPATHSKATLGLRRSTRNLSCASKYSLEESRTYLAPYSFLRRVTCSYLQTTFITGILFSFKSIIIILPNWEAAPVYITALAPSLVHLSRSPIALTGFPKEHAPFSQDASSSRTVHWKALVTQYSAKEPPLVNLPPFSIWRQNPTRFPMRLHASHPPPYATTVPDPSPPGVSGYEYFPLY